MDENIIDDEDEGDDEGDGDLGEESFDEFE